jgi:hypothetical protein
MPKHNFFLESLPRGSKVIDCGRYFVAIVKGKRGLISWGGDSRAATIKLNAAVKRGAW